MSVEEWRSDGYAERSVASREVYGTYFEICDCSTTQSACLFLQRQAARKMGGC